MMKPFTYICSSVFALLFLAAIPAYADDDDIDWDWWKTAVVYQIYPKSFKDDNNDGYGDLRGIINKLPHLADAGVTAVWLSPIYPSPQVDDGYDISDFKDVWETFGTLDEFDELVEIAHSLGLKVVMDLVPNHSSNEHEWFVLSENGTEGYEDYYVWREGNGTDPPNNWISVFKYSAWNYSETRGLWYLHQFTWQQPDLNYRNPKVLEEMTDVLKFWLDRGVDGFRIDAIPHLFEDAEFRDEPLTGYEGVADYEYDYLNHIYTKDLNETYEVMYYWREYLDNYTRDHGGSARILMAEVTSGIDKVMLYYTNGQVDGAHFPFNFQLIYSLSESSTASDIVSVVNYWLDNMPSGNYVPNWEIGNHDQTRAATRFGKYNVDAYNMLNLLLPGIAVTYNGEEIGMENGEVTWEQGQDPSACNGAEENFNSSSRDFERTPYHWDNTTNAGFNNGTETWLPVSIKYLETNLYFQSVEGVTSHYKVYQDLTSIRKENAFTNGGLEIAAVSNYVTAFTRSYESDVYVVVLNTADSEETVDLTSSFSSLDDDLTVVVAGIYSSKSKGDVLSPSSLTIQAYESLVLKKSTTASESTTMQAEATTSGSGTTTTSTADIDDSSFSNRLLPSFILVLVAFLFLV